MPYNKRKFCSTFSVNLRNMSQFSSNMLIIQQIQKRVIIRSKENISLLFSFGWVHNFHLNLTLEKRFPISLPPSQTTNQPTNEGPVPSPSNLKLRPRGKALGVWKLSNPSESCAYYHHRHHLNMCGYHQTLPNITLPNLWWIKGRGR